MSFKDDLLEEVAKATHPHLWNNKLEDALNRSRHFTAEQAAVSVEQKRTDTKDIVAFYLTAALPLLLNEIYARHDPAHLPTLAILNDIAHEFGVTEW